jgi:hypothetical protein
MGEWSPYIRDITWYSFLTGFHINKYSGEEMKMHFVFGSFFWGMILLLLGLGIILRAFNIHLPLLRIFFGLIIILIGIKILIGISGAKMKASTLFDDRHWESTSTNRDFNIIFGTGVIDLTKGDILNQFNKRDINVIFGSGTVLLNESIPTIIDANTVFGHVHLPTRDISLFGQDTYKIKTENDSIPTMRIEANAIFGEIYFKTVSQDIPSTPEDKE